MGISKFNHTSPFTFKASDDFEYYSLQQLYKNNGPDSVYRVLGLYINDKGSFGKQPLALTPHYYVNLPSHLLNDVTSMIEDQDIVDQINAGHAGFKIRTYVSNKYKKTCYSVEWADLDDDLPY